MQTCPDACLIDLTDQQFEHLYVRGLGEAPLSVDMDVMWRCRCTCGKTVEVAGSRLRQGLEKSCGCDGQAPVAEALGSPAPRAGFLRTFLSRAMSA